VGFRVKLSDENIVEIECLRVVAMATNFGTKIAITGFVRTRATRQLVMEGFEWSADRMQILAIPCTHSFAAPVMLSLTFYLLPGSWSHTMLTHIFPLKIIIIGDSCHGNHFWLSVYGGHIAPPGEYD